eukprot:6702250-Lingulodinium_polyedra.AAC.1
MVKEGSNPWAHQWQADFEALVVLEEGQVLLEDTGGSLLRAITAEAEQFCRIDMKQLRSHAFAFSSPELQEIDTDGSAEVHECQLKQGGWDKMQVQVQHSKGAQ